MGSCFKIPFMDSAAHKMRNMRKISRNQINREENKVIKPSPFMIQKE